MFGLGKTKKKPEGEYICVVIPAAGESRRMGGENKLLLELCDVPVLVRTVAVFECCEAVDEIVITCRELDIVSYGRLMRTYGFEKVKNIVRGGKSRTESVLAGVHACPEGTTLVAIHDGARPLVTDDVILEALRAAADCGAAAPVTPLKDSIKRVEKGKILADVPRIAIAAVQTPQVFRYALICEALESAMQNDKQFTDDCAAVEALGADVCATTGSYENIKITTPEDIAVGEAILRRRENE